MHLSQVLSKVFLFISSKLQRKNYTCDHQDDNDIHRNQDLINVDYLKARMSSLREAFPEPFFNHAMAVKVENLYYIFDTLISFYFNMWMRMFAAYVCISLNYVNIFQMESNCMKGFSAV